MLEYVKKYNLSEHKREIAPRGGIALVNNIEIREKKSS